jgi:chaperonin GroEL
MKAKKIITGVEARKKLASGAEQVANAVASTLGPRSKNVAINRPYLPHVIHDGVTVARAIKLIDPFEDMGAQLIKEAAGNTNDGAGDGTTTATVLANALIQEGMKLTEGGVDEKGVIRTSINSMELKDELLKYSDLITTELDKLAKPIKTSNEIRQVATVSAQNKEIGELVAKAIEKVGAEGVVMVEEANSFKDEIEYQEGMDWDNGFLSPYFITDAGRMLAEYSDGYVLITDKTISDPEEIIPIIEKVRKHDNKPLLIIADSVVGSALQTMALSKVNAGYLLIAVSAPEFGERRKEALEDLAILTDGVLFSTDLKKDLKDAQINELGRFRKLVVDFKKTQLTPLNPDEDEIAERVKTIKEIISREENTFNKERQQARLAKFTQGVAIISVGGGSVAEIQERKERYIDAVHATKCAIAEGVVAGGGVALVQVAQKLENESPIFNLIRMFLYAPRHTILKNAGTEDGFLVGDAENGEGYDVVMKATVNMIEHGIIDPVKVTKLAVKNAISVASMILTTETLISEEENEKDNV